MGGYECAAHVPCEEEVVRGMLRGYKVTIGRRQAIVRGRCAFLCYTVTHCILRRSVA